MPQAKKRRPMIRRRRGRPPGRRRKASRPKHRGRRVAILVLLLLAASGAAWLIWPFWRSSARFGEQAQALPSRLYARPLVLTAGAAVSPSELERELEELGYRAAEGNTPAPGEYRRVPGRLTVHLRPFPSPEGFDPGGLLEVRFTGRWVAAVAREGRSVDHAALEPALLASYYGPERQERRPVALEDLPQHLIHAVLAAEDATFFDHPGLSISGIARAAWVNLRGGELQGGSTVTQQLVKNLFLTHERTWGRKLREAVLAIFIDLRYSKPRILEAYLNEIYLGLDGPANLMGVGPAARVYFGKPAERLTLCESALLAAMIRSPGNYLPSRHPERARERRDWVLRRMADLDRLDAATLEKALAEPLCYAPRPLPGRRAPYFVERAAEEAVERYGIEDLQSGGYLLLSTLDWRDQRRAEEAVSWGVSALEKGWEKGRRRPGELQAALVSLDPASGEILAWVGGRDYGASQFDRAGQARRQAGSAFKPVVYATAFESGTATPSTLLEDAPLTVALAGRSAPWVPSNSDGRFRGLVSARTALEGSLNVPTARLALEVGLERIVDTAHRMGIQSPLQPVPALALGAFEVTPAELAVLYATIANRGARPDLHGLRAVLDRQGRPLRGRSPEPAEAALSAETAYVLTSILQGVLERGTASSARLYGVTDPLAGKTGTTNGRRDSWFAGFSPERASLVWVGYDDNAETNLSGTRAGLPIWSRFAWAVRPDGGYAYFSPPPGVTTALIDPLSGELASEECPRLLTEVYLDGSEPRSLCHLHAGWRERRAETGPEVRAEDERRRRPFRWLRRIFGKDKDKDRDRRP